MKKTTVALTAIILVVVIVVASYGVFTLFVPSETGSQKETVTLVDGTDTPVNITIPVERVISLSNGLTEIICALGCGDQIVGRDAGSTFPPSISEKPVVGESSYNPDLELLLELEPDVVFSDGMMSSELRGKIEDAGVPVFIENTNDPERMKDFTKTLGLILDQEEKADEIVEYIENYENIVRERIGTLTLNEKPLVYFEWGPSWTCSAGTVFHEQIEEAGGINMAANESTLYPTLSSEYIVETNPEVILKSISQPTEGATVTALQDARDEVLSRPGYNEIKAVKEGKVYIYYSSVGVGIRRVIGLLYWAKWLHPTLFEDIDPAAIHEQMSQRFFGIELDGVYGYP